MTWRQLINELNKLPENLKECQAIVKIKTGSDTEVEMIEKLDADSKRPVIIIEARP